MSLPLVPPRSPGPDAQVISVNVARPRAVAYTSTEGGLTGIDRRPAEGPVAIREPDPEETGAKGTSALADDVIGSQRDHGGRYQAVYAFAREDLDRWEQVLGRPLPGGVFGENLTTRGIDVNAALVGERWRIGSHVVLEATLPRIPCRTFAGWLDEERWVRRFTEDAAPGSYFRVVEPGEIRAGDPVEVVSRPDHDVSIGVLFRALTLEPALRPRVQAIMDALPPDARQKAARWGEPSATAG